MSNGDELRNLGMHAGAKAVTFRKAKALRKTETRQERALWLYLKLKPHGFKFRRQHPFDIYILDFYCHQLRLCIEVDGLHHMTDESTVASDHFREEVLEEYGVRVIRFTNAEIDYSIEKVLKKIVSVINERKRETGR